MEILDNYVALFLIGIGISFIIGIIYILCFNESGEDEC